MGLGSGWLLTVTDGGVSGSGEALRFAAGGGDAARMGPITRPEWRDNCQKEGRATARAETSLERTGCGRGQPLGRTARRAGSCSPSRFSRTQAPLPAATSSTIPSPVRGPSVLQAHWVTSHAPRGRG